MIAGKLEVTININKLPEAKTIENNWQQLDIDCDGRIITVTVKPKVWKKLTDAATNYPQWVAAITGKLDQSNEYGFVLAVNPKYRFSSANPKQRPQPRLCLLEKEQPLTNMEVTKVNNNNLVRCEKTRSFVRSNGTIIRKTGGEQTIHKKLGKTY
ncbi:hypothetical protein ACN23B_28105 (plasmid) [Anabaena sp. FACHB-709]|uniref:Fertility inhibition FinO-like protein n=1 Tax=Trichormus variabilis NIES-23 TaxID=1973479 RepID=A0A1Z4KUH4_ANAVA|nr:MULTISPECIES: hypothetical protein [Nostocaceae]RUR74048.1 hypothetical protein DSM107007_52510 [Nostoc sp. PCC 7120 = FACHB-418]BAY72594.1 hypothetical protein NIES23_54220 [Trichormus variabilis NIES-23]